MHWKNEFLISDHLQSKELTISSFNDIWIELNALQLCKDNLNSVKSLVLD